MSARRRKRSNVITGAPFGAGPDSPLWADVKTKIGGAEDRRQGDARAGEGVAGCGGASGAEGQGEAGL